MRGCSCRGTAGFAHVSCLAEQAKILFQEAEENNLDDEVLHEVLVGTAIDRTMPPAAKAYLKRLVHFTRTQILNSFIAVRLRR